MRLAGLPRPYVLGRSDRPAAFARGTYYAGDGPVIWYGSPQALSQLGLEPGAPVDRDDLVAALLGQHAVTGDQIRRPGSRTVERDGEVVSEPS